MQGGILLFQIMKKNIKGKENLNENSKYNQRYDYVGKK